MSDSATTYYDDVIDQHTHGFQWIEKEFGECAMPKSAWHVDQFGHSREHSSIFAQVPGPPFLKQLNLYGI